MNGTWIGIWMESWIDYRDLTSHDVVIPGKSREVMPKSPNHSGETGKVTIIVLDHPLYCLYYIYILFIYIYILYIQRYIYIYIRNIPVTDYSDSISNSTPSPRDRPSHLEVSIVMGIPRYYRWMVYFRANPQENHRKTIGKPQVMVGL